MGKNSSDRFKFDPLNARQTFTNINVQLHCCRYWMIMEWECDNLASPFWRLYHNTMGEASVNFDGNTIHLTPEQILIIPPNTSFSSRLRGDPEYHVNERHVRRKINDWSDLQKTKGSIASDHLFIHFNLGLPFDLVKPGIYTMPMEKHEEILLFQIKDYCIRNESTFDFRICATIKNLILSLLGEIPYKMWETPVMDKRVASALFYIEQNIGKQISNKMLSDMANMVENSFARLFKENAGISIHQYIKKKRIDKALILIQHINASIDEIANECGFSDRHHFSRVFKEIMGVSPVRYRKNNYYFNLD